MNIYCNKTVISNQDTLQSSLPQAKIDNPQSNIDSQNNLQKSNDYQLSNTKLIYLICGGIIISALIGFIGYKMGQNSSNTSTEQECVSKLGKQDDAKSALNSYYEEIHTLYSIITIPENLHNLQHESNQLSAHLGHDTYTSSDDNNGTACNLLESFNIVMSDLNQFHQKNQDILSEITRIAEIKSKTFGCPLAQYVKNEKEIYDQKNDQDDEGLLSLMNVFADTYLMFNIEQDTFVSSKQISGIQESEIQEQKMLWSGTELEPELIMYLSKLTNQIKKINQKFDKSTISDINLKYIEFNKQIEKIKAQYNLCANSNVSDSDE